MRRTPTAAELALNENPPPPQTCAWMLDEKLVNKAVRQVARLGPIPTDAWEREVNSVRDYVEVIAGGIAENLGWILTGGVPIEDGKKPGDFATVREWDPTQKKEGLTVTEMLVWAICTVSNRGVSGLAQHEPKGAPTNEVRVCEYCAFSACCLLDSSLTHRRSSQLYRQFREHFESMNLKKGYKKPPVPSRPRIVPIMDMINHDPNGNGYVELDEPDPRKILKGSRLKKRPVTPTVRENGLRDLPQKAVLDDGEMRPDMKYKPYSKATDSDVLDIMDESKDSKVNPYLSLTTIRRYANSSKHYADPKLKQEPGTFVVYRPSKNYKGEVRVCEEKALRCQHCRCF